MSYNKKTKMYEGYIYKIYNKLNDKLYIGQTRTTIILRWNQHKSRFNKNDTNYALYNAMGKYGFENFYIKQIKKYECNSIDELIDILNVKESFYIKKLNTQIPNGYNITAGGEGVKECGCREIVSYNPYTDEVRKYKSINEASLDNDVPVSNIVNCCKKVKISCKWKIYRYKDNGITKKDIENFFNYHPIIIQYDLNGNRLNKFTNIKQLKNFLELELGIKINTKNIVAAYNGYRQSAYGFVWRKNNEKFNMYSLNKNINRNINKRVCELIDIYDFDGNLLYQFDNIKIAFNNLGLEGKQTNQALRCCDGKTKTAFGFIWRYRNEPFGEIIPKTMISKKDRIVKYSQDGEIFNTYNSLDKLSKEYNVNTANLKYAIKTHKIMNDGYVLFNETDTFNKNKITQYSQKQFNQYTLDNNFVQTYNSFKIAANKIGGDSSGIIKCCKGKIKSHHGYKWYYSNDENQPDNTRIIKAS